MNIDYLEGLCKNLNKMYYRDIGVATLLGKTLVEVKNIDDTEIIFITDNGEEYKMYHVQECCEGVSIEDINGDLQDLVGSPVLKASEDSNSDMPPKYPSDEENGSYTWTFYNIATIKGHVTIRWYGSSNGCYSESVTFARIDKQED